MIALIHLFLYVLEFPTLPSARSDLALLDVAAGYFGQLDMITDSKLSFPFARDIATLASRAVNKAVDVLSGTINDSSQDLASDMDFAVEVSLWHHDRL